MSNTTNPVTQVAEVAVNSASKKLVQLPLREENGKQSKNAPSKMMMKYPRIIVRKGESLYFLCVFFILCVLKIKNVSSIIVHVSEKGKRIFWLLLLAFAQITICGNNHAHTGGYHNNARRNSEGKLHGVSGSFSEKRPVSV